MKVIIFGATGMVGQGVLLECLRSAEVESILAIGRSATGKQDPKITQIVQKDLCNYASIEDRLRGYDACFFCLGVASAGMSEPEYSRVTYDMTIAAAQTLARLNPAMTFIYVSGMGSDSSEKGRIMWARVRGRTENKLLSLPFKAYVFRPGFIQPLDGIQSRTPLYRVLYKVFSPLMPAMKALLPGQVTSTVQMGRAMLSIAKSGYSKKILEMSDITKF